MEEARTFINSLPEKVQSKIDYNIGKSMFFIDDNVFKKLENTEHLGISHIICRDCLPHFCFLGQITKNIGSCNTWAD